MRVLEHIFLFRLELLICFTKKVQSPEEKVELLETEADKREQYTRRPNLQFSGIAEAVNTKHK